MLVLLRVLYSLAEIYFERDGPRRTWRGLVTSIALVILCASAFGQNVRWDLTASTTTGSGQMVPMLALPGAYVNFYTGCTTLPCSTPATTYISSTSATTCASGSELHGSRIPESARRLRTLAETLADGFRPGLYQYVITVSGHQSGPYNFNVGGGGGSGFVAQVNGTPLITGNSANFINSPSVTFTNPSTNQIQATVVSSGVSPSGTSGYFIQYQGGTPCVPGFIDEGVTNPNTVTATDQNITLHATRRFEQSSDP